MSDTPQDATQPTTPKKDDPSDLTPAEASLKAHTLLQRIVNAMGGTMRDGQDTMARGIANLLTRTTPTHHQDVLVQAGTGTGKSLAWLAGGIAAKPVIGERHDGTNGPLPLLGVTHSKALMDQLVDDLTLLDEVGGLTFTWALLKGRASYLCLDALHAADDPADQTTLDVQEDTEKETKPRSTAAAEWALLHEWAETTTTGDRSDLPEPVSNKTWAAVSRTSDDCTKTACPFYDQCFPEQAARKAAAADVVVSNMALLALDMRIHEGSDGHAGVLPAYGHVIVDEAHEFPSVVSEAFGAEITLKRITDTFKTLESITRRNKGGMEATKDIVKDGEIATEALKAALPDLGKFDRDREAPTSEDVQNAISLAVTALTAARRRAVDLLPSTTYEEKAAARPHISRFTHLIDDLMLFAQGSTDEQVAWVEASPRSADEPVIAARTEAANRRGERGFTTVSVPEASLLITQGVGRLIRTIHDTGAVGLYDPRLNPDSPHKKGYARTILRDLPPFTVTHDPAEVDDLLAAADQTTQGDATAEDQEVVLPEEPTPQEQA